MLFSFCGAQIPKHRFSNWLCQTDPRTISSNTSSNLSKQFLIKIVRQCDDFLEAEVLLAFTSWIYRRFSSKENAKDGIGCPSVLEGLKSPKMKVYRNNTIDPDFVTAPTSFNLALIWYMYIPSGAASPL